MSGVLRYVDDHTSDVFRIGCLTGSHTVLPQPHHHTGHTLYGLIFYANIIQVNTSIFFSQSILKPLQVIVSFENLDLGLPLSFYDGMDDADKAGFQFVFPAYLLILTMTVIVFCHYCLQRSPITSTTSCCK